MATRVELYYYPDCPSHEGALARLQAVLDEAGLALPVAVIRVETLAEAQRHGFAGSPTVRIDGLDIDPASVGDAPQLTCRAYRLEDGRISPLPSETMIRRALGIDTPP
ncbi:MAG: hypothetical protein ACFCBW_00060 [Candidatus Competibacterales bacterium]